MPSIPERKHSRAAVERPRGVRFDDELYALAPWYHDFRSLGFDTAFLDAPLTFRDRLHRARELAAWKLRRLWIASSGTPLPESAVRSIREVLRRAPSPHVKNQPVKERRLLEQVVRALSALDPGPDCLELFCADGFYSCCIKSRSPGAKVTGVDRDPDHVRRARTMARRLRLTDLEFVEDDVEKFLQCSKGSYDLVLCAGGLYHMSDPHALLLRIVEASRGFLVLQSVVTLETEDKDYFVAPAPGWRHGCRFTHAWLRMRLHELGLRIEEEARAELPANRRRSDRGSSFFLCRVP